ncbi:hypothetical protein NST63_27630 [Heyndrickxia sp. FSL W8-0496]|uniref:hypothetical protein n=1 Tax=Heyndrickxia sp. FSL W8-0496 TaxID=2954702 RepID=UPI0030F78172
MSVFKRNQEILDEKGSISYWLIADHIGIHENTLRNWMKTEMNIKRKKLVLKAIHTIKHQEFQEAI